MQPWPPWDSRQTLRCSCGACVQSERCSSICLSSSRSTIFPPVEFYRVDVSTSSLCSCICEWSGEGKKRKTAGARWGLRWGQVHFRKRLLVVGGALQGLDKPKDGSEQQKTLHQTKTKVWNIKSSVLQKDCLILHLSVTLRAQNATQNSKKRGLLLSVQEKVVPLHS